MAIKSQAVQIVELEAKVTELEKKLAESERVKTVFYQEMNAKQQEMDSVHEALDSMKVPKFVNSEWGGKTKMTMTARLFAWQAGATREDTKEQD